MSDSKRIGRTFESNRALECAEKGREYASEGRSEEALVAFRKALYFDTNTPGVYADIAEIYVDMCDFKTAIAYLKKACKSNPASGRPRLAEIQAVQNLLEEMRRGVESK